MPLPAGQYTVGCSIGCYAGHTGQDFRAAVGTDVYSSNAGIVVRSAALIENGRYVSYGNLIVIRDAANPSIEVYYAHLSRREVAVGDAVTAGQGIGASGNTGNSEGPHLHYEIRVGGSPTDPMLILQSTRATP
jgi:murein DD-endopeptidase MepM/ murein hydrolase activator NlpD